MNNIYQCPVCFGDVTEHGDKIRCTEGHQFPIISEHRYFLPLFQTESWSDGDISLLERKLNNNNFMAYAKLKKARNIVEPYAQIQPFNESFQSLLGFIEVLKEKLKPDDVILDTWCRTGFSGDFLANIFPEQHVVSIWEGDNSVMGYKGFHACFEPRSKAPNHTIVFHEPNKPLPFKDNSFAFVYGYDSLHRYTNFVDEVFRVAKKNSIVCFAHVHLSNAEPDPFFERGGVYRSGEHYFDLFSTHSKIATREVTVHSEIDLYLTNQKQKLNNNMYTDHYNGFIWIAKSQYQKVAPLSIKLEDDHIVIINPLYANQNDQLTIANNENAQHVFLRHPVLKSTYLDMLKSSPQISPSLFQNNLLLLGNLKDNHDFSNDSIRELIDRKLIFVCKMSRAMQLAQAIHMNVSVDIN